MTPTALKILATLQLAGCHGGIFPTARARKRGDGPATFFCHELEEAQKVINAAFRDVSRDGHDDGAVL